MLNLTNLADKSVHKVFNLLNASIYWKDIKGNYLGCNNYTLSMFDLKNYVEIIGKNDYDIIPKNEADKIVEIDQSVLKGNSYSDEEVVTCANGELKTYFTIKNPIVDNSAKIIGIFGVSIDITNSKKNEELKIRQIIDVVDASIYWKDREGRYLGCNKYVLGMAGINSLDEIVGKTDFDMLWKNDTPRLREIDNLVMTNNIRYEGEEIVSVASNDGKPITLFTVKNPLLDNQGNVIGIVGTSLDIMAQKEAEELKLETHRIQDAANREIIATKEKFEKLIEEFANHLQSPLTSLQSVIAAKTSISGQDLAIAKEAVIAITDISNKILGKYDKNIKQEARQALILSATILDAINAKKIEFESSAIDFHFNFGNDTFFTFINIQPSRFHKMLANLIDNAIEALENKSGTINLKLTLMGDLISIAIEDTGRGMSKEQRQKIINNIVVNGNNKKYSLGYVQVRKTLQDNNGDLAIYSKLGYGSVVIVGFPVAAKPNWIVEKIKVAKNNIIVILDEDESIYSLWETKLKDIIEKDSNVKIQNFTEVDKFIDFTKNLTKEQQENLLLLTEYKFTNYELNGLEIIDDLGIRRAILVTSYYSDLEIREEAVKMMVKILPKLLISHVTVMSIKKPAPGSRAVDFVWVNDDKRFIDINIAKYYTTSRVDVYYEPASFLENFLQYSLNTTMILNDFYATGIDGSIYKITGFDLARELHDKGYQKLYLLSSTKIFKDNIPNYVKIIQKDDNKTMQKLNKL